MSAAASWRIVAQREFRQRTRSKAFVIGSLVLAALVVVGIVLTAVLRGGDRERIRVVLVDQEATTQTPGAAAIHDALVGLGPGLDRDVRVQQVATRADAEAVLRAGDGDVGIDGTTVVWRTEVDDMELAIIQAAVQSAQQLNRAEQLGLDADELRSLLEPPTLTTEVIDPQGTDHGIRTATAGVGLVLLFLAVQLHGTSVLMGVVEEKSSRVVEVLLGHVRPRALLLGKVIGIGAAGLVQVLVVAVSALAAIATVRSIDAPKVPASAIVWFVVWFVLGFTLYATVFASLGSLVSRQEDAQSVAAPATVPLIVSYIIGFGAVGDASATVARVASIVPLSAPMVMPVRLAAGRVATWELALSLVLVAATLAGVLRVGARLYERNVLRSGAARGWRHAAASLRSER